MKKWNQLLAVLLVLVLVTGNIPFETLAAGDSYFPGWKPGASDEQKTSSRPNWPVRPPVRPEPKPQEPAVPELPVIPEKPVIPEPPVVPEKPANPDQSAVPQWPVIPRPTVPTAATDPTIATDPTAATDPTTATDPTGEGAVLVPKMDSLDKVPEPEPDPDQVKAAEVDQLISAIGKIVMPESEPAISAARNAYEKLTDPAKALVTKLLDLQLAEEALPVTVKISLLPADIILEDSAQVKAAKAAYDALHTEAKALVGNLEKLTAAEKEINELLPAAEVEEAPEAVEGLIYDATIQTLVTGGKVNGGSLVYSMSADGPFLAAVPKAVTAGDYTFYYKAQGDAAHKDSDPVCLTLHIQKRAITVDVTVAEKQYNGKTDGIIASAVLKGVLDGDTVTAAKGKAVFESAAVNTGIPVTITELELAGEDAVNYTLTPPTGVTGNIVNLFNPVAGKEYILTPSNPGWIREDLKVTPGTDCSLQLTNTADAPAEAQIPGGQEGENQSLTFYVKNAAGEISNPVTVVYSLDKTAPAVTGAENGQTYYDGRSVTAEDLHLQSVTLDGTAIAIQDGKALMNLKQAAAREEHVIAAEDIAGNRTEMKFILEPLSTLTGETAHITESNLTKGDLETLETHIQKLKALKKSDTLSAEDQKLLDGAIARDQALIDRIHSGALEAQAEIQFISAYAKDTVTSADRAAIQASMDRMDALLKRGTLPHEVKVQLTAARARAAELLVIIDANAALIENCTGILKGLETDTVKYADRADIVSADREIDLLLAGKHLTETERKSLEAVKAHGEELLQRIKDAYDAVHTGDIERTRHVHKNNVQFGHREDLEDARDQLKHALKAYKGNYTDHELENIEETLERVEAALRTLDRAASAIWKIDQLPLVLQEGDNRTMAAIENAKRYYDSLTVHEMYLVGMTRYNKLMDLYDSYAHYQIAPMYQEPDSLDVVFQVTGPFKKFVELRIDNAVLEKDVDYTVKACKEGTEIVLKDACLKTLGTRRHEIEVDYRDGIAVGSITNRKVAGSWLPKTADSFHVSLWIGTLAVSFSALAVLMYLKKKRTNMV